MKTLCWGSPNINPGTEWLDSALKFNQPEEPYAFGLKAVKGSTKAFQLVVQSFVLKHLMFGETSTRRSIRCFLMERTVLYWFVCFSKGNLLRPNETTQRDALYFSLADLLWTVSISLQNLHLLYQRKFLERIIIYKS